MKPYSKVLRERIRAAIDHHESSLRQIAHRFRMSLKTVCRWMQLHRLTGSLSTKSHGGRRLRHRASQEPSASAPRCHARRVERGTAVLSHGDLPCLVGHLSRVRP